MSGRKKKKALGVRVRRARNAIDDFVFSCIYLKMPIFRVRDRAEYRLWPYDALTYCQRYHPRAWAFIRDVAVPVLVSIPASLLGVKLALWYFTTHISGGG